jgi:competence protein ComEC
MLRIHFLNVGHGDCTIIEHHSGRLTMVDINTSQDYDADSLRDLQAEEALKHVSPFGIGGGIGGFGAAPGGLAGLLSPPPPQNALGALTSYFDTIAKAKTELTDPIAFMQNHYRGRRLWRFILTHPDLDHMRGIRRLYETIGFDNFWDTRNTRPTPNYQSDDDKVDWEFYQELRNYAFTRTYMRGDALFAFARDEYGQPGGDGIEILSPTPALVQSCNMAKKSNDLSLVLRLWHGTQNVLLPGDAETKAWDDLVAFYGGNLKSTFLKASHHGRDSGFHLNALRLIAPRLTFVSVGRKPDTDASSKYRQQSDRVASTRYHGNIELRLFDDGQYQWLVDRNPG